MKPMKRNGSRNSNGNKMMLALALASGWLAPAIGCMSSDEAEPAACAPTSGHICSIAGTGIPGDGADDKPALATKLYLPQDVTIGPDGRPFIVDWNNHRIRVLQPNGTLHIVAGVGELGLSSDDPASGRLNHPTGVAFDQDGKLVIAAWHNSRIKLADDLTTGTLLDTCGNGQRAFSGDGGPAAAAALNLPVGVVFDQSWNMIIADQANQRLRKVDHVTGIIETIAGNDPCPADQPCDIGDAGPATAAHFAFPPGQAARPGGRIDIDAAGNIYVADTSHFRVRRIDPNGVITTLAGNGTVGFSGDGGPAQMAQLSRITDVAAGPDGNLYIADNENSCIRMVDQDGNISTVVGRGGQQGFAGDGGPVSEALLNRPYGIAFDPQGNLYIADTHNNRIRVVYR